MANWLICSVFAAEITLALFAGERKWAALRAHWLDAAICSNASAEPDSPSVMLKEAFRRPSKAIAADSLNEPSLGFAAWRSVLGRSTLV
jgi:hypothetical protein